LVIRKVEDVLVDFAEGDVYSAGWKQWLSGGKFSLPTRARLIHRDGAGRCNRPALRKAVAAERADRTLLQAPRARFGGAFSFATSDPRRNL
jgi:hypothetical protein